jgi:hypothetical protein
MSQSVEWGDAAEARPELVDDAADWSDAYGSMISPGNAGIWLSETMLLEGAPEELQRYATRFAATVDLLLEDPSLYVRPARRGRGEREPS